MKENLDTDLNQQQPTNRPDTDKKLSLVDVKLVNNMDGLSTLPVRAEHITVTAAPLKPGEVEEKQRYAKLCESLRPPLLSIPGKAGIPGRLNTELGPSMSSGTASIYNRYSYTSPGNLPPLHRAHSASEIDENAHHHHHIPHYGSHDDEDIHMVFSSSLHLPTPLVIPENRIKTPRTPQVPRSATHRRTLSPTDERCLGPIHQSPSGYLVNRYKAQTPKAVDFRV